MITCPVFEIAMKAPHLLFLNEGNRRFTYEMLNKAANGFETVYEKLKGNSVGLIAENCFETYASIVALYRLNIPILFIHPKAPKRNDCIIIDPRHISYDLSPSGTSSIDDSNPIFYFLSSGSTNTPKIIAHSFKNLMQSALSTIIFYGINEANIWLSSMPLNHVGGLMIFFRMALSMGSITLDINSPFHYCSFVPTQLYRFIRQNSHINSLQKAKKILIGGAPIPNFLIEECKKINLELSLTYGMTEMASQITAGDYNLGKPLKGREIKISKDGEILIRGNSLFLGYGINPVLPKLIDGFFPTRDLGKLTPSQDLIFIGRKDRLIIKGGENISPEQLESFILDTQLVFQAYVLGIEDQEYGEKLICFIDPFNDFTNKKINCQIKETFGSFFQIDFFFKLPSSTQLKFSMKDLKTLAHSLKRS